MIAGTWLLTIYLGIASVTVEMSSEQTCRDAEAAAGRGELIIELSNNTTAKATRAVCVPPPAEACDDNNPVG